MPIGYPILLEVLYRVFHDYVRADFALLCLSLLLYFGAAHVIFRALRSEVGISPYLLFLVFSAFSFVPFHLLYTVDLLSLALFVAACAASVELFRRNGTSRILCGALVGIWLFGCAAARYAYYPLLPLIPFTVLIIAWLRKDRTAAVSAMLSCVLIGLLFLLVAVLSPSHFSLWSGVAAKKVFNWDRLLLIDPFPLKAFFFTEPFQGKLSGYGDSAGRTVWAMMLFFSLCIVAIIFYFTWRTFAKLIKRKSSPEAQDVSIIGSYLLLLTTFAILCNISYLAYLSVTVPQETQTNPYPWTFLAEYRYFAPSIFLIQVVFFILPFKVNYYKYNFLRRCATALIGLSIIYAGAYWTFSVYCRAMNIGIAAFAFNNDYHERRIVVDAIKSARAEGKPVAYAVEYGDVPYKNKWVFWANHYGYEALAGANRVGNYEKMIQEQLGSSVAMTLLVEVSKRPSEEESVFLKKYKARKVVELSNSILYRIDVPACNSDAQQSS